MENFTLSTTVPVNQTRASFQVLKVYLNWEAKEIYVKWKDNLGVAFEHTWTESTPTKASTLMIALNKANLSTKSLHKRVFEQLLADGAISPGVITGNPD